MVHSPNNQAKKFLSRRKNFRGSLTMKEKNEKSSYQNDLKQILAPFHEFSGFFSTRRIGLRTFCTTIFITMVEKYIAMAKYNNSRVVMLM